MVKSVNDFINQYSESEPHRRGEARKGVSIRISVESMILLETLSAHLGQKKTPLMSEMAESVIHDVYDRLKDDMEPEAEKYVAQRMQEEIENV